MPRRRRGAHAAAIEADAERGLAMRMLLHSPKDMVAGALAFAAVSAIIANALFLQAGRHPSPMFGSVVVMPPAAPAAVKSVAASAPGRTAARRRRARSANRKPSSSRVPMPKKPPSQGSPMPWPICGQVDQRAAVRAVPTSLRPPAPIPISPQRGAQAAGARRVAAVQRALTEYGYGQLKPTGTVGSDTQAAIQKFERDRNMPVTGQMSDRLVRELTAMIGHPID